MSVLIDLMLSEKKFKVCIRIPFASFLVVVVGFLLHYHQSVVTSYKYDILVLFFLNKEIGPA